MDNTRIANDELRVLVRRALLGMLQGGQVDTKLLSDMESPFTQPPPDHEITVTLRGNLRSIALLEEALRNSTPMLEIGLDAQWGPKVRVRAAVPGT